MARTYARHCDHCREYYEGYGDKYCSIACGNRARAETPTEEGVLPRTPDESIHYKEVEDELTLYVEASRVVRTPEQLVERARIDTDKWEVTDSRVRTWSVPMKVEEQPTVLQMYYVGVTLRRPVTDRLPVQPVVIQAAPHQPRPSKPGLATSVHYSDCHFPYQDDRALEILYQILHEVQPEVVVNHGDLLDCEQIGRFAKDPYDRTSVREEVKMAAAHIARVHDLTPNARHILLEGNHEDRLKRTIWDLADKRTAGELLTLPGVREALRWEKLLGLDGIGWEFVPYPSTLVLHDRLVLAHGSKVRNYSAGSAKAEHDQYGRSGMSGHTHRMGAYYHTDYHGTHEWVELGLMGRVREDYVSHANWQQGFAVVTWSDGHESFWVEHVAVRDGRAMFRGRIYGA